MRIGLVVGINGNAEADDAPRWTQIREQVRAAESAGFDLAVFEDGFSFAGNGMWDAMTMVGALAGATSTIRIGHSVVNAPLRRAGLLANAATTLDEISDGRYVLGIGAGNTPDDYAAFDIPADPRVDRFEEVLRVITQLLRTGHADIEGRYHSARNARLYPRGPSPSGPPIVVAGRGPRMMRLCAELADAWNWFVMATDAEADLAPIVEGLEAACELEGRDPATLPRTLDVYSFDILGLTGDDRPPHVLAGDPARFVERLAGLRAYGIDEVRVDLVAPPSRRAEAAEAMASVVEAVHGA